MTSPAYQHTHPAHPPHLEHGRWQVGSRLLLVCSLHRVQPHILQYSHKVLDHKISHVPARRACEQAGRQIGEWRLVASQPCMSQAPQVPNKLFASQIAGGKQYLQLAQRF